MVASLGYLVPPSCRLTYHRGPFLLSVKVTMWVFVEKRMGQMGREERQGASSRLTRAYCSRSEVCVWRATPAWMKQPKG